MYLHLLGRNVRDSEWCFLGHTSTSITTTLPLYHGHHFPSPGPLILFLTLPTHHPLRTTSTCRLVVSVGVFVAYFLPSRVDVPQVVQGMVEPSLSFPIYTRHSSRERASLTSRLVFLVEMFVAPPSHLAPRYLQAVQVFARFFSARHPLPFTSDPGEPLD